MANTKTKKKVDDLAQLDSLSNYEQNYSTKHNQNLVVKSNRLNEALQSLTLPELRIIQLGIVDARETGKGLNTDKPLRIDGKRYAEVFGTTLQNGYMLMKQAEDTLFNRRFSFTNKDGNVVKSRWVQQIEYLDNQGGINICFTIAVVEAITRIDGFEEFFTQYYLEQTAPLIRVYSVRLYELLVQWKKAGKTKLFEIETFRAQMGIENHEYKVLADFKKRVLDVAVKEINEKTDLMIEYKQEKKGRTVIGFKFSVKSKNDNKTSENQMKTVNRTGEQANNIQPSWMNKGLTDSQINKLARNLEAFVNANNDPKILGLGGASSSRASYQEIFNSWRPLLSNPKMLGNFKKIQDFLDISY